MKSIKFVATLSLLLFLAPLAYSQQIRSIHQIEIEMHRNTPTTAELLGTPGQKVLPLQKKLAKAQKLSATIFGYLPYWSSSSYLHYDLLTHIAAFSVEVNPDGTLGNDHGWPWTALINQAHSKGVKVILVATLFDGARINTLITNASYKQRFFQNIKNKMLEGKADGVNIDFEGGNSTRWRSSINAFMSDLTDFLHTEVPGSEVSFAGPAVNWGGSWDLAGLAASCDYIFIMGYDFNGSWSTNSGPNAPLTGGSINITNTVNNQYGFVTRNSPQKLILGVPYYGLHWQTFSDQPRDLVINWVGAKLFSSAQPGALTYGTQWDEESQTPWYTWNDGSNWNQVWFDNDSSLALKYNLARIKDLKGVGMWALGYDGNRQELWNVLDQYFGSGQEPVPDVPLSFAVLPEGKSALRIQFEPSARATGYFAYLSDDGLNFPDSTFLSTADAVIRDLQPGRLYFVRLRAVNATGLSQPTEVLAGTPSETAPRILVVEGFDRTSGTVNPMNYIRQHARAIETAGYALASCTNEAIYRGKVSLRQFEIVDWILGDESTADETFNSIEQDSVKKYLQQGGKLFVSGSEIGWDLEAKGSSADKKFYADFLKADYISDAPRGRRATYYSAEPIPGTILQDLPRFSFDNGSHGTFDVDWPDAIIGANGASNCLKYTNVDVSADGGAGIYFEGMFPGGTAPGKLVYFAIPFETIYPETSRNQLMQKILAFFIGSPTAVADNSSPLPQKFRLYPNYPNPFNPSTNISFSLPTAGRMKIEIFNMRGERVRIFEKTYSQPGLYRWQWHGENQAGHRVASGAYFYRAVFTNRQGQQSMQTRKMLLLQ